MKLFTPSGFATIYITNVNTLATQTSNINKAQCHYVHQLLWSYVLNIWMTTTFPYGEGWIDWWAKRELAALIILNGTVYSAADKAEYSHSSLWTTPLDRSLTEILSERFSIIFLTSQKIFNLHMSRRAEIAIYILWILHGSSASMSIRCLCLLGICSCCI